MWKNFKKFEIDEIEFCPYPEFPYAEKKNRPGFVNISPTLVIDTSTERSSRVLQHKNQKIWFFFSKKFEIEFDLYFDLCWRAEIIQVGLNMHLYVDTGMHRRPFEGRHLVYIVFYWLILLLIEEANCVVVRDRCLGVEFNLCIINSCFLFTFQLSVSDLHAIPQNRVCIPKVKSIV